MQFKNKENDLIWESMHRPHDPEEDYGVEDYESEDFEAMMPPSDEEEVDGAVVVTVDDPVEPLDAVVEVDEDAPEEEGDMNDLVITDIKKLDCHTKKIAEYASANKLEPWMQAKIVKAAAYVADVLDQLEYGEADFANDQDLDVEL